MTLESYVMAGDDEVKPFYLREYKKGGKSLGEILHELSTDEILKLIERINQDSPENVVRREEMQREAQEGIDRVNEVEKQYFIGKRGKHAKFKDKPKSYRLQKGKEREESAELIRQHAYSAIERDMGKSVADHYRANPHKVLEYLGSKGVNFYQVQKHLADNPRTFRSLREGAYAELKARLALVDNEEQNLESLLETEITQQPAHHEPTKKWADQHAGRKGVRIKPSYEVPQYLGVAKSALANKIDQEYINATGYVVPAKGGGH